MVRRLLTLALTLSLLACAVTAALWIRSWGHEEFVGRESLDNSYGAQLRRSAGLYSKDGRLFWGGQLSRGHVGVTVPPFERHEAKFVWHREPARLSGFSFRPPPVQTGSVPSGRIDSVWICRWGGIYWCAERFSWDSGGYECRVLCVPHAALVVVTALLPLAIFGRALFWRRRARPGHCAACGYDLRATPDRCPECGHVPQRVMA